jgi:hypothetical protein
MFTTVFLKSDTTMKASISLTSTVATSFQVLVAQFISEGGSWLSEPAARQEVLLGNSSWYMGEVGAVAATI